MWCAADERTKAAPKKWRIDQLNLLAEKAEHYARLDSHD